MTNKNKVTIDGRKLIWDIINWKRSKIDIKKIRKVCSLLKELDSCSNPNTIKATNDYIKKFSTQLFELLKCSKSGFLPRRDLAFENIIRFGQELLRKRYSKILNNIDTNITRVSSCSYRHCFLIMTFKLHNIPWINV